MKLGMALRLGSKGGGVSAPFTVSFTGLSTDSIGPYGQIGNHASIGYTTDATAPTVKWSNSSNPADPATYGTGLTVDDFTASDGALVHLHVTDGGDTVSISFTARYAPGTAPAVADGQSWTVDDTNVSLDGSASGANLTFTYALTNVAAGVTINTSTGSITGIPTYAGYQASPSDTATITATDQYGRDLTDTFTWTTALRAQATGGADLDLSFPEDSAISATDLAANWNLNGNSVTFVITGTALPASLSCDTSGIMNGTPNDVTADATYTLQGTDTYSRVTTDTFTLEITAAAVNPSLTLNAQNAGSGGSPDSLGVTYSYAGADTVTLYVVTTSSVTAESQANVVAGTGGNIIEGDSQAGYTGTQNDLDGFTTDSGVTHIQAVAVEDTNGGTSGVQVIAISDIDFTAPAFSSAEVGNVDADTVRVTFNDTMYGSTAAGEWTLTGNTISSTSFTPGNTYVDLTLGTTATASDDYTGDLSFTGTSLTDERGNAQPTFSGQNVTNNVGGGVTVTETTALAEYTGGTGGATKTWTGVPLPTNASNETLILMGSVGNVTLTSATIDGQTATIVAQAVSGGGGAAFWTAIIRAASTANATGSVVITSSGNAPNSYIGMEIKEIEGATTYVGDADAVTNGDTINMDRNTVNGDIILGIGGGYSLFSQATSWSGLTSKNTLLFSDEDRLRTTEDLTGITTANPRLITFDITPTANKNMSASTVIIT